MKCDICVLIKTKLKQFSLASAADQSQMQSKCNHCQQISDGNLSAKVAQDSIIRMQ